MAFIEILKGYLVQLFFQTSWSFDGRQSLGFLTVLAWLIKKPEERKALIDRFSPPFNTNPFAASFAVGTVLKEGDRHQASTSHILAAYGDDFFWHTLRPAVAGLSVLLGLAGAPWAPLAFVVLFNLFAQGIRFAGLPLAFVRGRKAILDFGKWVNRVTPFAQVLAAIVIGMLLFLFFSTFIPRGTFGYFAVAGFVLSLPWLIRRLSPSYLLLIYLAILVCVKSIVK